MPPPNLVLPFIGGALLTWMLAPGGDPSSFRGAAWTLLQLALVALPLSAAMLIVTREKRDKVTSQLAAWAGAALVYGLVLLLGFAA